MLNCHPLSTPMQTCIQLSKENSLTSNEDQHPYLQMVGSLIHAIVNSRLEYKYIVSSLSQYLSSLAPSHIQNFEKNNAIHQRTLTLGIEYQKSPSRRSFAWLL